MKTSLLNNYLDGTPVALSWNKIQIEVKKNVLFFGD
jgi:hypothetical protein